MDKKIKTIFSFAVGAISAVIFITIITIAADLYLPLKDWLKNAFSHHWIGKSVLAGVIFLGTSFLIRFLSIQAEEERLIKALKYLIWITILGTLIIFLFFIFETLK